MPAVVLAAGGSRRFSNGNKLLAAIDERPILVHVVEACRNADRIAHVYVVLGHEADNVHSALQDIVTDPNVTVLINERWDEGLSTSLHTALNALDEDAPGVLIVPGDMPFMTSELIDRVADTTLRTNKISFPTLNDRKGHPTAFPRKYFEQLRQVDGDVGAREIVQSNWDRVETIPLEGTDAKTQIDIDTEDDLP